VSGRHPPWRYIILPAGTKPGIEPGIAGRNAISADDARAWAGEQRPLGAGGDFFFACIQFCFTATRL
jgi:hypothetical protein